MSWENVEVVKALVRATQRGDWTAALEAYDPAVELDATRLPGGGIESGRDGVERFFRQWFGTWENLEVTPERFIDAGGHRVVVLLRIAGVGKGSGIETFMRTADVMTVRAGKVIRHVGYLDVSEALQAAGLQD
jgi:ketosteroid isomerase-like protein